ncbi:MAG: MBG domain-containing protein [Clostridia bacterium]|nr:MBG domain-containing protein [Clostridia bacterium]
MWKRIFSMVLIAVAFIAILAYSSFRYEQNASAIEFSYFYIDDEADWETFLARAANTKQASSYFSDTIVELRTDLYFYRRNADPAITTKNTVIQDFKGIFEGNGHAFVGLNYVSNQNTALFNLVDTEGIVRNLNIVDLSMDIGSGSRVGGVAVDNRGLISNVKVSGVIEASTAGGIVFGNIGTVSDCFTAIDYTGDGISEFGAVVYQNGATVTNNYSLNTEPQIYNNITGTVQIPADTLVSDGFIDDFYELLYIEQTPALAVSLAHDINLYNQNLSWANTYVNANHLGKYYFYNNVCYDANPPLGFTVHDTPVSLPNLASLVISGSGLEGDPYVLFASGDGTQNHPYRITNATDWQRLAYLYAHQEDWGSFGYTQGESLYFKQTEDITLLTGTAEYYEISVNEFSGVYDGSGFSVSGVIDGLFESITPNAIIQNLHVHGEVRTDAKASVVQDHYGLLTNVSVRARIAIDTPDPTGGGLVYNHYGNITLCEAIVAASVAGDFGALAYSVYDGEEINIVSCRSKSQNLPFVYISSSGQIARCYNEGELWIGDNPAILPSASFAYYGDEMRFSEGDDAEAPYQLLVTQYDRDGWAWANEDPMYTYWSVLSGDTEDNFVLRLPYDIGTYKTRGKLELASEYHKHIKYPYQPEGYSPDIVSWFSTPPPSNRFSYEWTFTDQYYESYEEHTDAFTFAQDCGAYDFIFYLAPSETETWATITSTFEIEPIDIDYHACDLRIKNDTDHTLTLLPGNNEVYPFVNRTLIVEGVTYIFDDYLVEQGVTIDGIFYKYEGEPSSFLYSSNAVDLTVLKPFFAPENAECIPEIIDYVDTKGNTPDILPGDARNAGTYKIKITIVCANYITDTITDVFLKIDPKEVRVSPYLLPYPDTVDNTLPYNHSIDDHIAYLIHDEDIYDPLELEDLAVMGYETNYQIEGEEESFNVGFYEITSFNDGGKNNNYVAIGQTISFEVVKVSIADLPYFDQIQFDGVSLTYDGQYHTIAVSGLPDGFAVRYTRAGASQSVEPYQIIDAGIYEISAEIYIDSDPNYINYLPAPLKIATLTIAPKSISVTIQSYTIDYGQEPPLYDTEDYSDQIVTRADNGIDEFATPIFSCTYMSGSNAGTYPIGFSTGILNPNYSISVVSGTLTVNKISRGTLALANTVIPYNGAVFTPLFPYSIQAEIDMLPQGNISYYREQEGDPVLLDGAPKDAGRYLLSVNFGETDNYIQETLEATLEITIASLNVRFLLNGQEGRLDSKLEESTYVNDDMVYNSLKQAIRLGGIPLDEAFCFEYHYTLDGTDYLFDSEDKLEIANAGFYENIHVTVSGNPNYHPLTLYAGSFHYLRKILRADYTPETVYNTREITIPNLAIRNFDAAIYETDWTSIQLSYRSYKDDNPISIIKDAGVYEFTVSVGNANYIVLNDIDNNEYFPFVVKKYETIIDFADKIKEVVYGKISDTFVMETTYDVGGYQETATLTYNVAFASGVGVYDVLRIDDTNNIRFTLLNGNEKYIVHPKTVRFDWELSPSYYYKGTERTDIRSYTVDYRDVEGREGNDNVGVTLDFSQPVIKDVGEYRVSAYLLNPNYELAEENLEFIFQIIKAPITVRAKNIVIDYLSPIPVYTATVSGLLGEDTLQDIALTFDCSYSEGDNVGDYDIMVTSFAAENYVCDISNAHGVLTVMPIEQTGLSFPDLEVVYNGEPFYYLPTGVLADSEIYVDRHPKDAGAYTLTATITLANYLDSVLTATLTVLPATPTVSLTPLSIPYIQDGQVLSSDIITGSASFQEDELDGHFEFGVQNQTLLLGEHAYPILFIPDSENFVQVALDYYITSAIEDAATKLDIILGSGTLVDGTINSTGGTVRMGFNIDNNIDDDVVLYVNDSPLQGGFLELSGTTDLKIEVVKNGILLASYQFNIVYHEDEEEPNDNEENNDGNDGNNSGAAEPIPISKPINWPLIGGIAGGAAGGIILLIVIIKVIQRVKEKRE